MSAPRPILKRTPSSSSSRPLVVHFPPSTSLTRTYMAYPASTYDRTPITVSRNTCALPERGCPGRTYSLDESSPTDYGLYTRLGGDLHPFSSKKYTRSVAFASDDSTSDLELDEDFDHIPTYAILPIPSLIPDGSSESEESDDYLFLCNDITIPNTGLSIPKGETDEPPSYASYPSFPFFGPLNRTDDLAFLPHPLSPPGLRRECSEDSEPEIPKKPRRRRDRPSRPPVEADGYTADNAQPRSPRKYRTPSSESKLCKALSSFNVDDSGCLGGF